MLLLFTIIISCLFPTVTWAVPAVHALALRQDKPLPNCDDTSKNYEGSYKDDSGTYVTSDQVSHPYRFPLVRKCWWDYYVVETSVEPTPWKKSSGNVYCTGTERCVATKLTGAQVCKTKSESLSVNVGFEIEKFKLGAEISLTQSESRCVTADDSTACQWNDQGCHTVWTQQQILRQKGYRRKRCDWGKGDETQCMGNWEQTTPSDNISYGCGSKCTDTNDCGRTDGKACPKL
ncbi:hypothetical protein DER45DRAFT_551820 [Fusarium avenaceum]|nr:hypothetical protein DER45DRAFT_551820 [Fusarium avenaceum]